MVEIVYIDMDDVLCDYSGAYYKASSRTPEIAYLQSQYGFFTSLPPLNTQLVL